MELCFQAQPHITGERYNEYIHRLSRILEHFEQSKWRNRLCIMAMEFLAQEPDAWKFF